MGPAARGGGGVLDLRRADAGGVVPRHLRLDARVRPRTGGKTLAQEATAKSKTADDLINAIVAAQKTNLDNEKAAGWITADQETRAPRALHGRGHRARQQRPAASRGDGKGGGLLQTAATFLGMSVSDLQAALKAGKSLADLATSKGKSVATSSPRSLAPAKKNLDQAVTDGKITQAQETDDPEQPDDPALTNLVNGMKPSDAQMNALRRTHASSQRCTCSRRHH